MADTELKSISEQRSEELVSWVMSNVNRWQQHRDDKYRDKWEMYDRLYDGEWKATDKNRESERSKIVTPALQQAIDNTQAELEEAIFSKNVWFDVTDDVVDQEKEDVQSVRSLLTEDLDGINAKSKIGVAIHQGAKKGTGLVKLITEVSTNKTIVPDENGFATVVEKDEVLIDLEPVYPTDFVIDSAATTIDNGLGAAHVVMRPLHSVREKQNNGTYPLEEDLLDSYRPNEGKELTPSDSGDETAKLVEYYGLVPRDLLPPVLEEGEELVELFSEEEGSFSFDEDDLVEALVTVGNDRVLLRAQENEFLMKDRPFVAFSYEKKEGEFFGRGVSDKGINGQKALDAETRARIDAMAFAAYPMVGIDVTKKPRGADYTVRAGKKWYTNGRPSEAIEPFKLHGADPNSFAQAGEFERMVQMSTGAIDSAAPITGNPRNNTASGISIIQSTFIKRAKHALRNISTDFLTPLLEKFYWRQLQFNPGRYPLVDTKFNIITTSGLMARELEQTQLTQLLGLPSVQETPAFNLLLNGIIQNTSIDNKESIAEALKPRELTPQEQVEQEVRKQLEMRGAAATVAEVEARVNKLAVDTQVKQTEPIVKQAQVVETNRSNQANESLRNKEIEMNFISDHKDRIQNIQTIAVQSAAMVEQAQLQNSDQAKLALQKYIAELKAAVDLVTSRSDEDTANIPAGELQQEFNKVKGLATKIGTLTNG